jgi:hypothetical protein
VNPAQGPLHVGQTRLSFDKVRSLADGVLFEFGPSRQRDLQFRDQIG